MIRSRSWALGNKNQFAIALSFEPDPDSGRGASQEYSDTWGSFAIWVNGLNLCEHQELNRSTDRVSWYLLPLLRWLIDNWDYLLHEERLPNRNHGRDAWLSLRQTADPPPALSDEASEQWEEAFHTWWRRHSLLACREGGLFPNVLTRRYRDLVEFSWGPTTLAGVPDHYQFYASHGYARLEPELVVDQLEGLLDSATHHLKSERPDNEAFLKLRRDFESIKTGDRRDLRRLEILAGLEEADQTTLSPYKAVLSDLQSDNLDGAFTAFLDGSYSDSYVREAPQVCLMFGSVAPNISSADVRRLAALIVNAHSDSGESLMLKRMTREIPIRSALESPWKQGYDLAEAFHEATNNEYLRSSFVDIELAIKDFDIRIDSIELDDKTIRAVSVAGGETCPTVAINSNFRFQEKHPRRFTLAHELCHLLHDRSHGVRLAIASGPWAPIDIEKRANAFAAMLLMPTDLIESLVSQNDFQFDSSESLWGLCDLMQVSFSAAIEHACNLGYIDETTRDSMKQEVIESKAPRDNG